MTRMRFRHSMTHDGSPLGKVTRLRKEEVFDRLSTAQAHRDLFERAKRRDGPGTYWDALLEKAQEEVDTLERQAFIVSDSEAKERLHSARLAALNRRHREFYGV
jgi:hypothetical protein